MISEASPQQVKLFPELSFHYGLSLTELVVMPHIFLKLYIDRLPGLLAAEQLNRIEAACAPNMEQRDRDHRIEDLVDMANAHQPEPEHPEMSADMMQTRMAMLGIAVRFADDEEKTEG
jgi:hypothetical protein